MVRRTFLKKRLGYLSKTVFLFNVLAIVALLISYSASFINPKTFWPIAFFGLGYLPILIINIGFIAYWLLRKPKIATFSLFAILIGWSLLTKHWNYHSSTSMTTKSKEQIRVLSFNAHLFKDINDSKKNFKDEALKILDSIQPDIVCFQEYYSRIKGKYVISNEFKNKLGYNYHYFAESAKNDYEAYGMTIFSKYPIVNSGNILDNDYGINRISYADIQKNDSTIRVYNVHLRSFALQNEDKEFIQNPSSKIESDDHASRRVGRKLKNAFEFRSEQASSLKKHMNACTIPYIVMGDFNDTPMSYSVNLVSKGLHNAFKEKGTGWGVTHYEMLPIFQIDYIFASTNFEILSYHIIKKKLSDHYPIWSDLRLN
ncbi:endonuclease/exonuclease/phosphatase family protein [Sphingobacterium sp. SRCM116780]|uniref:endonuclease/exonuclease/phosphatase family protein n=1 Tax=Sphingobacterium sp. SRCM116780 TaxID=2907623 RepID=UPI001F349E16|nr:endonuclease/exonuclease/phosphatase family protein [Sphingobacterium sp. SRCM116780]UIR56174.1 endonuclease/exonuclease/phosphatase family protein [Sphingobacterium sp. SRCM116780]